MGIVAMTVWVAVLMAETVSEISIGYEGLRSITRKLPLSLGLVR